MNLSNKIVLVTGGSRGPGRNIAFAEDIGGVVAFLCSEEGRWVNAQRVEASRGVFL